jgi:hypothetical protein
MKKVQVKKFKKHKSWDPSSFALVIVLTCLLLALSVAQQPIRGQLKQLLYTVRRKKGTFELFVAR